MRNEHGLMMRMATIHTMMEDDGLRRTRYSSASMGDGVTSDKSFEALTDLANFECEDNAQLYLDELAVVGSLGRGAFSTVELVQVPKSHSLHARAKDGLFAIKRMEVENMTPYGGNAPLLPAHKVSAFDGISMMAEGALMKNLNHPNILKCYGAIGRRAAARAEGGVRRSALILDYAPGGTLRDHIEAGDYTPRQAVSWLLGVARGICYLHDLHGVSVAHRDLKPSNILLGSDGEMKIADLGLFRLIKV
jgi:serine/threonine protein kinase